MHPVIAHRDRSRNGVVEPPGGVRKPRVFKRLPAALEMSSLRIASFVETDKTRSTKAQSGYDKIGVRNCVRHHRCVTEQESDSAPILLRPPLRHRSDSANACRCEAKSPFLPLQCSYCAALEDAASALASRYLSRADSTHLVLLGTGALAPTMARAHCAVRPISRVSVWGRRSARAEETARIIREIVPSTIDAQVPRTLDQAISTADIVICATSSTAPILAGKGLKRGTFIDLVGSFSPSAREADDEVLLRSRIFVDTFDGGLAEAGDLLQPLSSGLIARDRIEGELSDLVCGRVKGRTNENEIILFKSVGTAIEDLAAVRMIKESWHK